MREVEVEGGEKKTERELVFLHTLSVLNVDNTIKTKVYQLPSIHSLKQKRGIVCTLSYRAKVVVSMSI